ncbi:MAG: hypothetical protein LBJ67_09795 [Planctomycetaceae bacterium]|nr:hypothetical protein [Planctomycetaceae bacterium]
MKSTMVRFVFTTAAFLFSFAGCLAQEQFEVTPPVQGGTAEVQSPDKVKEDSNGVISAATPQDAANAAVGKLTKAETGGVQQIKVASGIGYVALGTGSYDTNMANPVAVRIAKRNATIRAYLDAQRQLAEYLHGANINAETFVQDTSVTINDGENADGSLLNSNISTAEKLETAINVHLAGFILYHVKYDTDSTGAGEVSVSIIVTPKTIRGLASVNENKTILNFAKNATKGVEYVKKDLETMLQKNIIFPTGGKQIYIKSTKEFAFIGYAAVPININSTWPAAQQKRQKLAALTSAAANSKASLLAMIKGNQISYNYTELGLTQEEYKQFETDKGETQIFDNAKQQFVSTQGQTTEFRSAVSGQIPPGVLPETYYYDDNGDGIDDWAFSIAVYIPSVGRQASQLRQNISNALNPQEKKTPQPEVKPKASGELPSGQTTNDDEL